MEEAGWGCESGAASTRPSSWGWSLLKNDAATGVVLLLPGPLDFGGVGCRRTSADAVRCGGTTGGGGKYVVGLLPRDNCKCGSSADVTITGDDTFGAGKSSGRALGVGELLVWAVLFSGELRRAGSCGLVGPSAAAFNGALVGICVELSFDAAGTVAPRA